MLVQVLIDDCSRLRPMYVFEDLSLAFPFMFFYRTCMDRGRLDLSTQQFPIDEASEEV
jgi:hypothetical protein